MSKGKRRERQAAKLYERAGYETYRPQESKWGETDMFGLFDIFGIRKGIYPVLVQVKSNQTRGINDWFVAAGDLCGSAYIRWHYLVCHDRYGWRLARPEDDGYEWVVDEREMDCQMGEGVVGYLKS